MKPTAKRRLAIGLALGTLLVGAVGCTPKPYAPVEPVPEPPGTTTIDRTPRDISPDAPQRTNRASERTNLALPDEQQPVETTRAQQAAHVAYYSLDDVQMAIVGGEEIDRYQLGDKVAQELRELFTEIGFRVQNVSHLDLYQTDPDSIAEFAARADADLVTTVYGTVSERSRLGRMLSYEATIRANVYEAAGQLVATKELTAVGKRSSRVDAAAKSALIAAVDQVGPYLIEQIIRKVGQNVVTRRLTLTDMDDYGTVTHLLAHLRGQQGINDVRLMSWDDRSGTARMVIYLQPAAIHNLGTYIATAPGMKIEIQQIDRTQIRSGE
ncbi:MAG: hypothetical protein KAS72_05450 [Phycisphaerales bacterium]|nr:hypothetical protein [Phycisphaerales bacterium]